MKYDNKEFLEIIDDIINNENFQDLKNYKHHYLYTRLEHSISVSYYSYLVCKSLNLDYISVARAGLLHDLFFYDWRETKFELGSHAFIHPRVALRNAEKITNLSPMEKDIILKHMWGATSELPHYRESLLVDLVDDYLAIAEFFSPASARMKRLFHTN